MSWFSSVWKKKVGGLKKIVPKEVQRAVPKEIQPGGSPIGQEILGTREAEQKAADAAMTAGYQNSFNQALNGVSTVPNVGYSPFASMYQMPYQPMPQQQLPGGSGRQPYQPYSPFAPFARGPYNQQAFRMFGGYGTPQLPQQQVPQQQIQPIQRFQPAYTPFGGVGGYDTGPGGRGFFA